MYNAEDTLAKFVKTLGLKSAAEWMVPHAPKWVQRMRDRHLVRNRTRLVFEDELTGKYRDAIRLLQQDGLDIGDYLEFGVFNGTSLLCMHRVLNELALPQVRLVGFDSFEGLPTVAETDSGGYWRPGAYKSTLEFTTQVLNDEGVDWHRVVLVKGFFDATLNDETKEKYDIHKASVIMVDCDLHQSTKEALEFCEPLIRDKSVVFFDDWYPLALKGMGEKRAFDEFMGKHSALDTTELYDFKPNGKVFLVSRRPE